MPLVVACECGQRFAARDDLAGKTMACPSCGAALTVPGAPVPAAAAPAKTPIVATCSCGARFAAREDLIGKTLPCPSCGQPLVVGGEAKPATAAKSTLAAPPAPAPAAAAPITVTCQCGARFAARADLAGKSVACPTCKQPLTIPSGVSAAAKKAASPAATATAPRPPAPTGGVADLLEELGVQPSKTGIQCTNCRRDMQPGAHLCIHCGFNHSTGTMLEVKKWR